MRRIQTLPETAGYNPYEVKNVEYPTKTFVFNRSTKCVEKVADGIEAMRQAIEIILNTERYHYQIYSSNFGHELYRLIGKPPEYVIGMMERRVKEAFSMDTRILGAENFKFEFGNSGTMIQCTFDVKTVFGNVTAEVEL